MTGTRPAEILRTRCKSCGYPQNAYSVTVSTLASDDPYEGAGLLRARSGPDRAGGTSI